MRMLVIVAGLAMAGPAAAPFTSSFAQDRGTKTPPATAADSLRTVIKRHAVHSVAWERCGNFVPSEVRKLGEKSIDLADLLKLMSRSDAVDVYDDEVGFERMRTSGARCDGSFLKRASNRAIDTHTKFYNTFVIPRTKQLDAEINQIQKQLDDDSAGKRR